MAEIYASQALGYGNWGGRDIHIYERKMSTFKAKESNTEIIQNINLKVSKIIKQIASPEHTV